MDSKVLKFFLIINFFGFNLISLSFAQKANIGAVIGINTSKVSKSDVYYNGVKSKTGLVLGLPVEFYTSNELFSVKPSLFLFQKGFDDSEGVSELILNVWYAQLNLLFTRKFKLLENFYALVSLGPYGAYPLGGSAKRLTLSGKEDIDPLAFGTTISNGDLKPYDAGIKLNGGFEFILPNNHPLIFSLGYNWGVLNINNCKITRKDNFSTRSFEMIISYFLIPHTPKENKAMYDENE